MLSQDNGKALKVLKKKVIRSDLHNENLSGLRKATCMVDGAFTEEREREKIGAGGDTLILNMVNL